jgi:tRNA G37 N-methylase Trm5
MMLARTEPMLDQGMFRTVLNCVGLRIRNQDVALIQQLFGGKKSTSLENNILFQQNKRVKNILKDDGNDDYRIVLLDPHVTNAWLNSVHHQDPASSTTTTEDSQKILQKLKSLIPSTIPFETCARIVEINYEHLQAEDVLRKLLPPDVEVPSGFETIGHIAHLNLRPEHEPYK